jgi:hypothetical protein
MIPADPNEAIAAFLTDARCPGCGRVIEEGASSCGECIAEDAPPPLTCWAAGPANTTCVGPADHAEGAHTWVADDDIVVGVTPLGKGSVG